MQEADTAEDPMRIADIHTRLVDIDAWSAESRAAEVLMGLGFTQKDLGRPTREFSGGWRMRAAIAGVLFSQPTCSCSTSRPTISTSKGRPGLKAT